MMYIFPKWHFLFSSLVTLKIIKTVIKSIYSIVLKVSEEVELTLKGCMRTFYRTEPHSFNYHGLSSTQSQASNLINKKRYPATVDFVISDFSRGKNVTIRQLNKHVVVRHIADISHSPSKNIRKRSVGKFNEWANRKYKMSDSDPSDASKPVLTEWSKTPSLDIVTSYQRNKTPEGNNIMKSNEYFKDSGCHSYLHMVKENAFQFDNKVNHNQWNKPEKKCQNKKYNYKTIQHHIRKTNKEVELNSAKRNCIFTSLNMKNENNTTTKSKSIEKNVPSQNFNDCEDILDTNKKSNIEGCIFNFSADLMKGDIQYAKIQIKDWSDGDVFKDEVRNYSQIENIELEKVINLDPKESSASLFSMNNSTKTIPKSSMKDLTGPNFKNINVGIDTKQVNSIESITCNFSPFVTACLKKYDIQYTRNLIKDDVQSTGNSIKDDVQSTGNSIKDDVQSTGNSIKDDVQSTENLIKDEVRIFSKGENVKQGKNYKNLKLKETQSSRVSTHDVVHQANLLEEEKKAYSKGLESGIAAYLDYLREVIPVIYQIEFKITMLCKMHYNKSLISLDEYCEIDADVEKLLDRSNEINALPYNQLVIEYACDIQNIVGYLQKEIDLSLNNTSNRMKVSFCMKKVARGLGESRSILFSKTKESRQLGLQILKSTKLKHTKSKRRK